MSEWDRLSYRVFGALILFFLIQMFFLWSKLEGFDDKKMTLQAEIDSLQRKHDEIQMRVWDSERNLVLYQKKIDQLDSQLRDRLKLLSGRSKQPTIYFVTPTGFRPERKADLTRLAQTLAQVPNLFWIVVEDAAEPSAAIRDMLARTKMTHAHLAVQTRPDMKLRTNDPNWKLPRGVEQRNAALEYIRRQFGSVQTGVVYFGDDDNTYDWRLFNEMRSVQRVGVWPVGIVGALVVEAPTTFENGSISGFNAIWKPDRPFPVDMAAFAVNVTLIVKYPNATFKYDVPRGYQESQFLTSLHLTRADLEPKADMLTKVYVWHTRTEKSKFVSSLNRRLENLQRAEFDPVEKDALGVD